MATSTGTTQEGRYLAAFDASALERARVRGRGRSGEPTWLSDLRAAAVERFRVLGFPVARRGNEYWKYTDVGPIARAEFIAEPANSAAVGNIPRGVSLVNLNGATGPLIDAARAHLGAHAGFEDEAFTALNTALFADAVLIHVGEGMVVRNTLRIALISTEGTVAHPRVLIVAEPGSRLSVAIDHQGAPNSGYFSNAVTEVVVGEGASVTLHRFQYERPGSFHVATTAATVKRDAHFESFALDAGGGLVRHNLNVRLAEAGASCRINGVYVTNGRQHLDNHTLIEHASADTSSAELYKGVVDGHSHAIFMGRVVIPEDSQRTETHQSNKTLLMSAGAEVDSQPVLEIYADDVKATHGSAVGQMDPEALFYLKSRGLDEDSARSLLVHGFIDEVVSGIADDDVRRRAEDLIDGALTIGSGREA